MKHESTRFVSIRADSCFFSEAGVSLWIIWYGRFSCKECWVLRCLKHYSCLCLFYFVIRRFRLMTNLWFFGMSRKVNGAQFGLGFGDFALWICVLKKRINSVFLWFSEVLFHSYFCRNGIAFCSFLFCVIYFAMVFVCFCWNFWFVIFRVYILY